MVANKTFLTINVADLIDAEVGAAGFAHFCQVLLLDDGAGRVFWPFKLHLAQRALQHLRRQRKTLISNLFTNNRNLSFP